MKNTKGSPVNWFRLIMYYKCLLIHSKYISIKFIYYNPALQDEVGIHAGCCCTH